MHKVNDLQAKLLICKSLADLRVQCYIGVTMQKFASRSSFGAVAEKPVRESVHTRQVPHLNEASVAFHGGITAKQEHFSLKSASARLKRRAGQ